jgi:hypothetical protein
VDGDHDARQLGKLVDEAPPVGSGIGGAAVSLEVEGIPVFVKRIPLTGLELLPGNVRFTACVMVERSPTADVAS